MRSFPRRILFLSLLLLSANAFSQQRVKIKDVAKFNGLEEIQLFGYGLAVGLAGTGDRSQTIFTTQTITNMLKNMGIELPEKYITVRNVASVMITGTLMPFKKKGTRFDVNVSSLGDATSLEGGTLILSPLQGPDGVAYASAQGPLATGGYDVQNLGPTHIKKNHVLVGRIPDGALVQKQYDLEPLNAKDLSISLVTPDFSSAAAMAQAINRHFNSSSSNPIAKCTDAATIALSYQTPGKDSSSLKMDLVEFLSSVENIEFDISTTAKVVVNERTGTIVAGGDIRISQVAVTQGGVKVEVRNLPQAVQPQPFSLGQTTVVPNPQIQVEEKDADMVVLDGTTTVSDLAQALNSLGVKPRDVITIFQAIKEAGALHGQLVIM